VNRLTLGCRCVLTRSQLTSGFSRPTVNEAVRLLRDRRFVLIKPDRDGGLFVAARGPVIRLRHTLLSVNEGVAAPPNRHPADQITKCHCRTSSRYAVSMAEMLQHRVARHGRRRSFRR